MKVVIDRFEGGFAITELPDKSVAGIPLALLPGASEGDIVSIEIDRAETERRKKEAREKYKSLWKD